MFVKLGGHIIHEQISRLSERKQNGILKKKGKGVFLMFQIPEKLKDYPKYLSCF